MSYYGVIYPSYWTGPTGRAIRAAGGKDAQLLGAYLFSNHYMNMLGLYHLKLRDVHDELGLSVAAVTKAFTALADPAVTYAFFDAETSFVWVKEMARFRLNIVDTAPLQKTDKKAIGAHHLYLALPSNPWLGPFFDRYGKALHLKGRRGWTPLPVGLRSPFEGASEGLRSQ